MTPNPDFRRPFNDLINYVPQNLRNPVLTSLIDTLFNRFLTHDESVPLYGYVGRAPAAPDDRTPRVPQAGNERDINSIIPVLSFRVGTEQVAFTVQDLVKKAEALGVSSGGWQWLYAQGNNYLPPINLDKFTNFFNYYWVARSVEAVPAMPWNPELLPEYYTIASPEPSDLNKLNVAAATTTSIVLTGTGFGKLKFAVRFTGPTNFTITPIGTLGAYSAVTSSFTITSNNQKIESWVIGPAGNIKLLEFYVERENVYDQNGADVGTAGFETDDEFTIDTTFLSKNYTVTFSGSPGVKGKISKVKALNEYQVIDGVQVRAGDRVLVKNANPSDAGIYVVAPGVWTRAADFSGTTMAPGAIVFVKDGTINGSTVFTSISGGGGHGWMQVPGETVSNTNSWQEGNYWVKGEDLTTLGLGRSDVVQAVRPIIEYDSSMQLNGFVKGGLPSDAGVAYKQYKAEFNQLPLFDLFRYDGSHAGFVSSVFFYEEDLTEKLDLALQKRVKKSNDNSADFVFNHGMSDAGGRLLFVKRDGMLKTIWHAGYIAPHIADVTYAGVGDGVLSAAEAHDFTQQQIWAVTAKSPTEFVLSGSKMKHVAAPVIVGQLFTTADLTFKISSGSTPFQVGDTFTIRVGNLESPRFVSLDEASGEIIDMFGGPQLDISNQGAWQIPRTFFNNPYNDSQAPATEGVLYSHFRGILGNQVKGQPTNYSFGGSIKLWSEPQTLLAGLLMQRDMTPVSMIDLAQRQYETGLNSIRDIFQQNIIQYIADSGPIENLADLDALLDWILTIRAKDNDVRTVLYDSTSPVIGFPPTLPQLGIAELVEPTIQFDNVLGRTLLVHHDGHLSPLFIDDLDFRQSILGDLTTLQIKRPDGTYTPAIGSFTLSPPINPHVGELWVTPDSLMRIWDAGAWKEIGLADTLNSIMLRVEARLYTGINPNARKYDFSRLASDPEFLAQLQRELFTFAAVNDYAPLAPDYDAADPFTWNYSQGNPVNFPLLDVATVPARWYNVLTAHQETVTGVIPTPRPNLEPWKLFGYEDGNVWWSNITNQQRIDYTPYIQIDAIDATYIDGGNVRVVKTANDITVLSGLLVIDGTQLVSGDRVLIQNDTAPANNGIWTVGTGGWARSPVPLTEKTFVSVTGGQTVKATVWVLTATAAVGDPVLFEQARFWTSKLWEDVQALYPDLRLSVNTVNDTLLPPYISLTSGHAANALTNFIPPGPSLSYAFGDGSPVEAVWRRSLGFQYSLARALFRYDPLAFLGFCWGFNWVEVDGILYDGFDMQMPGHKRFKLHGEQIDKITRGPLMVTGAGASIVITYDAYDAARRQNFTVRQNGVVIGHARTSIQTSLGGYIFIIEDGGVPFHIGDRFEIVGAGEAMFVSASVHKIQGFGQVFTHALRETSIDTQTSYAISAFREWDVNMGYRAGGLVATDDLIVYTDAETLSPSAYSLLFKRNQIARNEWAQALRISVLQFGNYTEIEDVGNIPNGDGSDWIFRVEGYNPRYLDLTYYTLGAPNLTFNVDTPPTWYQPTQITGVVNTHLPLTITGIQNVVNFLFGYQRYLESRGWEFNALSDFNIDAETGRVRNFQLEIEKFIDRCYSGIQTGQGHVINPFLDRAWFNQETGLLSEFIDTALFDITGHPGVFDTLGVKYKKDDLDVVRTNVQSSFAAAGPMFSAHIQTDDYEHLFIFNNFSQPSNESGVLYDPFSGGRVATYKFNGRKQATNTMRPEFGGHFLVGNKVHQNIQASTDNVANFYDANHAFENEVTTRHSMALLGFSEKKYFDNLDISSKTQFNFWRGLIQAKGTNVSVDAYLNNNRFDDAKIDEYWAYKVAEYGDARQRIFPELKLNVSDVLTQFTQLMFDTPDPEHPPVGYETFTQINRFDEARWFSIEDMDQDAYFKAEPAGTLVQLDQVAGKIYKLPFIADYLLPSPLYTQLNATTIIANKTIGDDDDGDPATPIVGPLVVSGFGPARPRFNPIKLFNYVANELVEEIPMWHPAAGVHTPTAMESINIISEQNPARYNYSTLVLNNNTYDPLRPWGANEVGRTWLDTRNLAYLPYYDVMIFPNLDERLSRWGTLADHATVDVYEWVQSTVPPEEYNVLAQKQAGDADLDPATKAAGEVANQQTYTRSRNWFMRPIAWSFSPIPVDVDWGATPPFIGGSTDAQLTFENGLAVLSKGLFKDYGITAGMHIGAWNNNEVVPKPLSEWFIEEMFTKVIKNVDGGSLMTQTVSGVGMVPAAVAVVPNGHTTISGQLLFSTMPNSVIGTDTDEDGNVTSWIIEAPIRATEVGSGNSEYVTVTSVIGTDETPASYLHAATINVDTGEKIVVNFPEFGLDVIVTVTTGGTYPADALRNSIATALANKVIVRDAVVISPIVAGEINDMSNDLQDNDYRMGWRAWSVPTQAELDADGAWPNSSWKPYLGKAAPITGTLEQVQDAVTYAQGPLTLNDGTIIERYVTTWNNWSVLENIKQTATAITPGPMSFTFTDNIDPTRTSVFVNGIAQLKAAFTITGKMLNVTLLASGADVTVIIRRYEPKSAELAFDPDVEDNLAAQVQYKQDYEYVSLPVRDREGALSSTLYYFWVKHKTTSAAGKKLSVQSIAQEMRTGPPNYLTFQHLIGAGTLADPRRYDAITISGLSYVVTKDDAFKLRFTRNFTLRDEPEELNLKNTHTEWALMRTGQKTRVPESLWQKLIDSAAGQDAAGNRVPAGRRVLYDERNGTRTRFGFTAEQTLAPAELLRSSIVHAILNTQLSDKTASGSVVPDYITFLNFNESDTWFADAASTRRTMTDVWNLAKVTQVNEIFFAALSDVLASNYELSDIFKTSRLSAYSIKVVRAAPVAQTYE